AGRVERVDGDIAILAGAVVVARQVAAVFPGIDNVRVAGVGGDVTGLAASDIEPVAQTDAAGVQTVAWPAAGADVLHTAHHPVGHTVVDVEVIELRDRQRRGEPRFAAVERDVDTAVIAVDDPFG